MPSPDAEPASTVPQIVLRSVVIGYLLLIWLAVLPSSELPLVGSVPRYAERLLRAVSLRAGMSVFQGTNASDTSLHHSCLEVRGHTKLGWHTLYASACPPRGTQWRMDPLDLTLRRMSIVPPMALLNTPLPPLAEAPKALRVQVELGDYFCRLRPGVGRIVMKRELHIRNMRDGGPSAPGEVLTCKQKCRAAYSPPVCTLSRSEEFTESL